MNSPHPYDLFLGLDRSDKKADLCLIDTHTGQRRSVVLDTAPEALWEWLRRFLPPWLLGLPIEEHWEIHLTAINCQESIRQNGNVEIP